MAHYADAVQEYRACGFSLVEAHRAALTDLGEAARVGGELRETHFAGRRYALATVACLVFHGFLIFLGTMLSAQFLTYAAGMAMLCLFFLLPNLYVLESLGVLLRQRCFFTGADRALALARTGLVMVGLPVLLTLPLTAQPEIDLSPFPLFGQVFWATLFGGFLLLGVGLVLLGDSLLRLSDRLWGLRPLLCLMTFVCGFGVIGFVAGALFADNLTSTATGLTLIGYPILSILLALLFFRAAVHARRYPIRTA